MKGPTPSWCQGTECMLFWVRSCSFLLVYCLFNFVSDASWVNLRLKVEEHSTNVSSSSSSVLFPIDSFPVPPPVLAPPSWLGLMFHNYFYPLEHLLHIENPLNNAPRTWPILGLIAAFLPHGFCYGYVNHRRNTAHTTSYAVNGTYTGIGGAGGAYEDEDAFALSLSLESPGGWVGHSDARYTLWLWKKNVGRARGAQIEHLEPRRVRMPVPRDGL